MRTIIAAIVRIVILIGILGIAAFGLPHKTSAADLVSTSSGSSPVPGTYCTGSRNVDHATTVVRTGGPHEISVGQQFEALATVYNRTDTCQSYTVTIMMGTQAWKIPGGAHPRVTSGTIWTQTVTSHDIYIVDWYVVIKPQSHVNFYQSFEPSGTEFGPAQVIEIYFGKLGDVSKPHSAWAVKINQ